MSDDKTKSQAYQNVRSEQNYEFVTKNGKIVSQLKPVLEDGTYTVFTYYTGRNSPPDERRDDIRNVHFYYLDTNVKRERLNKKAYFQIMLESMDDALKKRSAWAKIMFDKYINEVHRFVFTQFDMDAGVNDEIEQEVSAESLDIPFECVHFEVINSKLIRVNTGDGNAKENDGQLLAFTVRKRGPTDYSFVLMLETHLGMLTLVELHDPHHKMWKMANALLKRFLKRLEREPHGTEKVMPRKINLGGGDGYKKSYQPKPVVYVRKAKEELDNSPYNVGGEIDWTHRWEVRGHWRKCRGVGKNPAGQYVEIGRTWVTEFEKGPEDKPLMKKLYVVDKGA